MSINFEETIQRCSHDKENPYVMISRELIKNKNISLQCRMFIIYLLSFDKSWIFSIPFIMKEQDLTRYAIDQLIHEARTAGYLKRIDFTKNNLKCYRYLISETPKFLTVNPSISEIQIILPYRDSPNTEKHNTNKEQSSSYEEERYKQQQPPTSFPEKNAKAPVPKVVVALSHVEKNRKTVIEVKQGAPNATKHMYIYNKTQTLCDYKRPEIDIPLSMPPEDFERKIVELYDLVVTDE